MLVGCSQSIRLFIYSCDGDHLSTVTVNDTLTHATWTPSGYIVFTSYINTKVVTVTEFCTVVYSTYMPFPQYLSVSSDNVIYLADRNKGIYQSTDDGMTWSLVFKSNDKWTILQVHKVTMSKTDYFWTWQLGQSHTPRLCVYSSTYPIIANNATCQSIKILKNNYMTFYPSNLLFDENTNILYSDSIQNYLHLFLVSGLYQRQLLVLSKTKNEAWTFTMDKKRLLMYAGESDGVIEVFSLNYQ